MKLLIPEIHRGELFAGFLGRMGLLNGYPDLRSILEVVFELPAVTSFVNFQLCPEKIGLVFPFAFEHERFFVEHTVLGVSIKIGVFDKIKPVAGGSSDSPLRITDLTFSPRRTELRYCPICMRDDLAAHGQAFWRSCHQIFALSRCLVHGERLLLVPLEKSKLHTSFPCLQDIPKAPKDEMITELNTTLEPTNFIKKLLDGRDLDPNILGQLYQDALKNLQLSRTFMADSLQCRGDRKLNEVDQSKKASDAIVRTVKQVKNRQVSPDEASILISLLFAHFGNYELFLEKYRWASTFSEDMALANGTRLKTELSAEADYRILCKRHMSIASAYIDAAKRPSRLGLTRKYYKTFKWLLTHEPRWLDENLPVPQRKRLQHNLF